jgi:hydroxymethylglutaryl-CoA synthase
MGKKALAYLVRHEWRQLPRWKRILSEIGVDEPIPKDPRGTIESVLGDQEFMTKDHEFTKLFTKTQEYQEVYESKLSSSLIASSMIGNLYTASLYGVVQPEYKEIVKNMNLVAELEDRHRLTLEEYEMLHENKLSPEKSMLHSKKEFVLVDVKTETESRGERRYSFNE